MADDIVGAKEVMDMALHHLVMLHRAAEHALHLYERALWRLHLHR